MLEERLVPDCNAKIRYEPADISKGCYAGVKIVCDKGTFCLTETAIKKYSLEYGLDAAGAKFDNSCLEQVCQELDAAKMRVLYSRKFGQILRLEGKQLRLEAHQKAGNCLITNIWIELRLKKPKTKKASRRKEPGQSAYKVQSFKAN